MSTTSTTATTAANSSTDVLDALEQAARSVRDQTTASVVSIGRNGRGSGVVIAAGRILTNAHNLRDRTTLVTFGDGRAVQGAVAGVDPHGDLAVLDVDTADAPAIEWATEVPETGSVVFAVARGRRGARAELRPRQWHRSHLPWSGWSTDPGQRRAHRTARSRLLGRPTRRSSRQGGGAEHPPRRRRLLPRARRRRRAAPTGRRARGGAGASPAVPRCRRGPRPCRPSTPCLGRPARARRTAGAQRRGRVARPPRRDHVG